MDEKSKGRSEEAALEPTARCRRVTTYILVQYCLTYNFLREVTHYPPLTYFRMVRNMPAAMTVPITPAILGPMANMSK